MIEIIYENYFFYDLLDLNELKFSIYKKRTVGIIIFFNYDEKIDVTGYIYCHGHLKKTYETQVKAQISIILWCQ